MLNLKQPVQQLQYCHNLLQIFFHINHVAPTSPSLISTILSHLRRHFMRQLLEWWSRCERNPFHLGNGINPRVLYHRHMQANRDEANAFQYWKALCQKVNTVSWPKNKYYRHYNALILWHTCVIESEKKKKIKILLGTFWFRMSDKLISCRKMHFGLITR